MVVSKINDKINYIEQKKLDAEDMEHDATTYETEILNKEVVIAIGKEKYTFINKDIIYFPVYLIKDDMVYSQIGLYEIKSTQLVSVIDDDGDLNIELIGEPLLYSFVTTNYLSKVVDFTAEDGTTPDVADGINKSVVDLTVEDDPDDPDEPDKLSMSKQPTLKINKEAIGSLAPSEDHLPPIFENMKDVHVEPISTIVDKDETIPDTAPWIQQYMKSSNYSIQDNEGGGDCFFAVIRDAFLSIGKQTTVAKLRDILARNVTDEIFTNYKQHFDMYEAAFNKTADEIAAHVKKNNELKREMEKSKSRSRKLEIVAEGKTIMEKYNRLKTEQKLTQVLKNEFEYMRGVNNLEDFKAKLRSCDFWAETWAISTLERVLNIKIILMSHEMFHTGDMNNVIQCGQLNDAILEKAGIFKPDYYIIADFNGYHYKLINYRGRKILKQAEIPKTLREMIVEKCCENANGPFSIIEGFKQDIKKNSKSIQAEVVEPIHNNLYDDGIIFQFYKNSSDKPYPGKGSGEQIPEEFVTLYGDLHEITNWRRMLSDDYEHVFTFDNKEWNTVSRCVEATQYKKSNQMDVYEKLLQRDITFEPSAKQRKEVTDLSQDDYDAILLAKFSQDANLKKILLKTRNALLMNYVKGKPPTKNIGLMNVRKKLSP